MKIIPALQMGSQSIKYFPKYKRDNQIEMQIKKKASNNNISL